MGQKIMFNKEATDYIVHRYLIDNAVLREIAEELNLDTAPIKRLLKEQGISLRSRSEMYRLRGEKDKLTGRRKGVRKKDNEIKPDKKGYLVRHVDGKTVQLHRQVMEKILNRDLLDTETVHHKNGDRADNREKNLELWSHSQPYGQRVEDKTVWAREILGLYGNDEERKNYGE